jgi:hypothetical protein
VSAVMALAIRQSPLLEKMCQNRLDFKKIDRGIFWKLHSIANWEAAYAVQSGADACADQPISMMKKASPLSHAAAR